MAPELTAEQMLIRSQHLRDQLAASLQRLDSYIELLREEHVPQPKQDGGPR